MRAWRGSGAAAHGPRVFFHASRERGRAKGVGPGKGAKTGRRPLLGPPARLSRALSQEAQAPSMHNPGHPRGTGPGTKKPGGPRRGVIVGRRASQHFTTRPGGDQTRKRPRHQRSRGIGGVSAQNALRPKFAELPFHALG
jgi:hypothetical protein